ncbi:MAG TPA: terminase small subunit [Chloroflexia bacterium]|nr:terminase small subunit [Chloroflexia bacterium]
MNNTAIIQPIPEPKPLRRLNVMQKNFCDWYIKLGGSRCATQAAIKAGYSEKTAVVTASKLLTKANIQAYLEKRRTQLEELVGFNKATILEDLHEIKRMSMKAEPLMYYDAKEKRMMQVKEEWVDENGVHHEAGVYQFDSNGANRAIENINKMMGYNEPEKVEDVTPAENKTAVVVINKTYVNQEPNQSTS